MLFASFLLAASPVAALAAASPQPGFLFPDAVPLDKRQESGPSYECHANCGYAIQGAANDGYCKDKKWLGLLDGCLDCALKYDIWKWYGDKVGSAAKACGLDATPKPASGDGDKTSSSAAAVDTTSAVVEPPASQTEAKPTESSAHEGTETHHPTAEPSHDASTTSAGTPPPATTGQDHGNATETSTGTVPTAAANAVRPVGAALGVAALVAAAAM